MWDMTSIRTVSLALLAWAAALVPAHALDQEAVGLGEMPPLSPDYKTRIVEWAKFFFPDPRTLRSATLSDPVVIRDQSGRMLWLVCVEAENTAATAGPIGPQRYAFGFHGAYMTAPRVRASSPLVNQRCDEQPLSYRPFRELVRR